MATGQNGDQQLLDHIVLTDNNATDLLANPFTSFDEFACCCDIVLGFNGRWLDQNKTCRVWNSVERDYNIMVTRASAATCLPSAACFMLEADACLEFLV